jgi:hypothetical protein
MNIDNVRAPGWAGKSVRLALVPEGPNKPASQSPATLHAVINQ